MPKLSIPIYSTDVLGTLALYVYGQDGYHGGAHYFRRGDTPLPDEVSAREARLLAQVAIAGRREVRITNADDFLVFHFDGRRVVHPENPEAFWRAVGA